MWRSFFAHNAGIKLIRAHFTRSRQTSDGASNRRHMRNIYGIVGICLFAGIGTYYLMSTKAAPTGWLSGASNYASNQDFGTWRGEPVTIVGTWCDTEGCTDGSSVNEYDFFSGAMDVAIGGIFKSSGESWSAAANGSYNSRWQTAISNIASHRRGKGTTYVRFAHEANMNFSAWSVMPGEESAYKTTYCAVASMAHAAGLKMTWSFNDGTLGGAASPKATYPGDTCVDVVGPDTYDWNTDVNSTMSDGSPIGVEAWRKFAESHGKPLAFPEWGLNNASNANDDDPDYISSMHSFMSSHAGTGSGQFLYDVYFNFIGTSTNYTIGVHPTLTPNAASRYQSLVWGTGTDTGSGTGGGTTSGNNAGTSGGGSTSGGEVSQTGNLLAGKTFSSSLADSTSEPGHPVSMITDGNGSTRWISQPTSPVNLTVDLGGNYALSKISIKWAGDTIHNFQFQISSNGSTWSPFYNGTTNNSSSQYVDYTSYSNTTTGRYLRIVGGDRWNSSYGNSIWEAGVYGAAVSATDSVAPSVSLTNPAAGAPVSGVVVVSGTATDNIGVSKVELLIDGAVRATNTSNSATFSWNSSSVGDGAHTIALRATDTAGNSTSTAARSVTVRNSSGSTPLAVPTISRFTASPASVTTGGRATLTWASSNAVGCTVTPGGPVNTTATSWQTAALTTAGIRTYTLKCTNSSGSASKLTAITVNAASSAPSKPTFVASTSLVNSGGSVTLSWSSAGATSCTLNPGNLTTGASASRVFTGLTATTTYSLSCKNAAGSTSATPVTVKVSASSNPIAAADPVISSFTATPTAVTGGQTAVLIWMTSGVATNGCNLSPSPLITAAATGSWKTPALSASTSYTLTCVNSNGKKTSKSVSITVDGKPAPAAPDGTLPPVNTADSNAKILKASNGQSITNAAATETISGLTTFDPSNITNSTKEQSILRVEYYNGETLVQTDSTKPFALDTTKLKNGRYTITERTYFIDGSQSEVTRVVTIVNTAAVKEKHSYVWLWFLLLLPLLVGLVFFILRRQITSDDQYAGYYPANGYQPYAPAPIPTPTQSQPQVATPVPVQPTRPIAAPAQPSLPLTTPERGNIPDWQRPIIAHEIQKQTTDTDIIGDPFLDADKQFQHAEGASGNLYSDNTAAATPTTSAAMVDRQTPPAVHDEVTPPQQTRPAVDPVIPKAQKTSQASHHPKKAKTPVTKVDEHETKHDHPKPQKDQDDGGVIIIDHHKK